MDKHQRTDGKNHVLEYYNKYSRNPDLSKYFSGTEASLRKSENIDNKPLEVKMNVNVGKQDVDKIESSTELSEDAQECSVEENENNKNLSPSSSAASIKKLEWDNGADIGYKNSYNLHTKKSASFPSLFTSDISLKSSKNKNDKSFGDNNRDFRNMFHHLTFSSESSSSPIKDIKDDVLSSSSSPPKADNILSAPTTTSSNSPPVQSNSSTSDTIKLQKKIKQLSLHSSSSSGSERNQIQKKIGFPVANSTPNEEPSSKSSDNNAYTETPMLRNNNNKPKRNLNILSNLNNNNKEEIKDVAKELHKKISRFEKEVNLCLTKPISLECIPVDHENKVDKISQTSFLENKISKHIQTEVITTGSTRKLNKKDSTNMVICSPKIHKIELVTYEKDSKNNESNELDAKKNIIEKILTSSDSSGEKVSLQYVTTKKTGSATGSKDYESDKLLQKKSYYNENNQHPMKESDFTDPITTSGATSPIFEENYNEKKESKADTSSKPPKEKLFADSESKELILAEMISLNHSRDLNTDIKRSIDILQRLLKSKKYDPTTKKHYIKQIVQKIVESKYSEDSTTSSELFRPKNLSKKHQSGEKISRETSSDHKTNEKNEIKLMDNVPWYPFSEPKVPTTRRKVKLHENRPKTTSSRRMVVTNSESAINGFDNEKLNSEKKLLHRVQTRENNSEVPDCIPITLEKDIRSSSEQKYQPSGQSNYLPTTLTKKTDDSCWKNAKTLSEIMLEKRDKISSKRGQGDYLLNVATNERLHQLSWINNEIEHLVKLKDMLEKKHKREPAVEKQMTNVISSLLQMKVSDMQGLSKNFEVFICKCCTTGGECTCRKCCCTEKKSLKKKKSACLTPGYYTIATQLDPEGNLMDLTVFDEEGQQKYNYKNDGSVEDVLIVSRKNSTRIKLKPNYGESPGSLKHGPYKVCKICKRFFIPPTDNRDVLICDQCFDSDQEHKEAYNKIGQRKICKMCGNWFISSKTNQCVCVPCSQPDTEPNKNEDNVDENWKNCEACEKSFLRPERQSETEIDKKCHCEQKKFSQPSSNICKLRDKRNVASTRLRYEINERNFISNIDPNSKQQSVCQNVNFSELLELDHCLCEKKNEVKSQYHELQMKKNKYSPVCNKSYGSDIENEIVEICPKCGRTPMRCICDAKFIPKKPTLKGEESYENVKTWSHRSSGENISTCIYKRKKDLKLSEVKSNPNSDGANKEKEETPHRKSCLRCEGVQVNTSPPLISCSNTKKTDFGLQIETAKTICKKTSTIESCLCKDNSTQHEICSSTSYVQCPSILLNSGELLSEKNKKQSTSTPEQKNLCCVTCQKHNVATSTPEDISQKRPRNENITISLSSVPFPRTSHLKIRNITKQCDKSCPAWNIPSLVQQKRSCQCCTYSHCGVQTKRGDRNARCQCCICDNCGIQVKPDRRNSRDSVESRRKELRPQNDEGDDSFSCPSKKSTCPAIIPPCPRAGNKPCPAYPPEVCPGRKPAAFSKRDAFPPEVCPGRKPAAFSKRDAYQKDFCPGVGKCSKISPAPLPKQDSNKKDFCPGIEKCTNYWTLPVKLPDGVEVSSEKENRLKEERRPSSQSGKNSSSKKSSALNENQQNMQLYRCTTNNIFPNSNLEKAEEPNNCICMLDTCKCDQTATHEEKKVQCPAFKQCTCQTEHKEDAKIQCACQADAGTNCKCGRDHCQCDKDSSSSSQKTGSTTTSNSDHSSETLISCVCCKKKNIMKDLMKKLPLCDPCQNIQQKSFYPYNYSNPLHSCICYSLVDRDTLCQLKSMLTQLERLDIYEQYCEVLKNCKCCKKCGCKCKLPKQFKNGCAYFLKLEDACPHTRCEQKGEEEFEFGDGSEEDKEKKKNYLPEVTVKVPNCREPCSRNNHRERSTKNQITCPSIQAYLCTMKPDFIKKAERRRRLIQNAVLEREGDVESRKLKFIERFDYVTHKFSDQRTSSETNMYGPYGGQMKAFRVVDIQLDDGPRMVRPRVFKSFKDMKDLTRRKYLHLSEVKNRKNVFKEKRLREANRILANTFTKRLQRSTLKGNVDIPSNVRVISY